MGFVIGREIPRQGERRSDGLAERQRTPPFTARRESDIAEDSPRCGHRPLVPRPLRRDAMGRRPLARTSASFTQERPWMTSPSASTSAPGRARTMVPPVG
jgi:hypothetical protein